jgi:hypothetical protein
MRAAWDSAVRGGSAADALAASPALRRAVEMFGPLREPETLRQAAQIGLREPEPSGRGDA